MSADLNLGTISSGIQGAMTIRYGRNLVSSYSTTLFSNSRTANPVAVESGWYVYFGVQAGYDFNQIFADGNTFRDSRSIDYDHEYLGATAGFAYSWQNYSLTFAINDSDLIQNKASEEQLDNLTRYGTLTFAWKI